jgi:hypothetical protein
MSTAKASELLSEMFQGAQPNLLAQTGEKRRGYLVQAPCGLRGF